MTIKLPIILSAMIAAFTVSGALASQTDAESKTMDGASMENKDAAPNAMEGEMKSEDGAMMEEKKSAKKAKKKKHHNKHKHHHHGGGQGHMPDEQDKPWDYQQKGMSDSSGCSGDTTSNGQGKMLPSEVPGQKGPNVRRGE